MYTRLADGLGWLLSKLRGQSIGRSTIRGQEESKGALACAKAWSVATVQRPGGTE